jgi:hypothetical protein
MVKCSPEASLPATTDAAFPRLDDAALNAVVAVAKAPLPALPPIDPDVLHQSFSVLDAALPRRSSDEASGKLMLAAYRRKLGHMPKEQIDFVCNAILERCRWFPTIAECLEIAGEWSRPDARERARARVIADREYQARMEDAHRSLAAGQIEQSDVDAWPERWRQIAAAQGLLHDDPDKLWLIRRRALPEPATGEPECPNPEPPSTGE